MTKSAPPTHFRGQAATHVLPAGTLIARVHQTRFEALEFNPTSTPILYGGGRFDGTAADPFPYLYGGLTDDTAVAETLLRDIPPDDHGARFLAKKYWKGRQLSRLTTTADVPLIALRSGKELGAVGQDTWLTACAPNAYPQTRDWARWLRAIKPAAAGLIWYSKREPASESLILFEDRCPSGMLTVAAGPLAGDCVFEQDDGFDWLRDALLQYRVAIRR